MLVVDDEPLVRWSIAETLGSLGYEVIEAEDAQAARRVALGSAKRPNLVLMDLKLPDNDDLSLLASMRTMLPDVPVILMTAFGTPEMMADARRLGAFTVLDKPFELEQLDEEFARALKRPPHH